MRAAPNATTLQPPTLAQTVEAWLASKMRGRKIGNAVIGLLLLALGALLVFISFWVTYGVLWFISHSFYRVSHATLLAISAGFMALVIAAGARQNWQDLDPLQKQTRLAADMDIKLVPYNRYGMSYSTNAMKAGAFEITSLAAVCNYILCGSVKLLLNGIGKLRQIPGLGRVDVQGCSEVIAWLWAAGKRQSFEEIVAAIPGLNPVRVFEDLAQVEGVLFLTTEPAGLTLHPELRDELNSLRN